MPSIYFNEPFDDLKAGVCESLTRFILKRLLPREHVTITFEIDNNLKSDFGDACAVSLDFEENEFTITIDGACGMREMCLCVAHELVHVKQFVKGEHISVAQWAGAYYDDPLEIEAYGLELPLFEEWLREISL